MNESESRERITILAAAAGLELAGDHFDDLLGSYRRIEPVLRRLPRGLPPGAEPAHIFDPRRFQGRERPE